MQVWCVFVDLRGLVSNKSYTNIQISRFWCMVPGGVSTARTFGVSGIQRTPYWECLGIRHSGMSQNVWHLNSTCFSCRSIRFFSCGGGHYIIPASSWHPNNRWCIDSRRQHPSSGLNGSSKKIQKINCCVCWVCCMPWVTRNFTCNSSPFSWMGGHGPSNNDWRIKMFKGCLGYLEWVDFQQDHGLCRMFCNIPINRQFIIQIEKWFRFLHIHFWMLLSGPSMFILSFPLRMDCCTKKHLHLT